MPYKIAALSLALSVLPIAMTSAQQAPPAYGTPINLETAKKIMAAAEVEARKNPFGMVITIVDSGSNVVMVQRMDNTQLASVEVAEAKAKAALNFRRSTKVFQDSVAAGGDGLRFLTFPGVVAAEGGELIVSGGLIIGAIGVSGGTSPQDGVVARAGLAALAK